MLIVSGKICAICPIIASMYCQLEKENNMLVFGERYNLSIFNLFFVLHTPVH